MIWLLIWATSIIINIIIVLIFMKEEKNKITFGDLFSFFIFGIIVAPLLTGFILTAESIKLYNEILNTDTMNKTIYKFK